MAQYTSRGHYGRPPDPRVHATGFGDYPGPQSHGEISSIERKNQASRSRQRGQQQPELPAQNQRRPTGFPQNYPGPPGPPQDYHRGPPGPPQDYQPGPPGPPPNHPRPQRSPHDYLPGPPGPQHRPPGPPQDYNHRPPGPPQNYPGSPSHHENYPGPPGAFQQEGLPGSEPTDKKAKKEKTPKEKKKKKKDKSPGPPQDYHPGPPGPPQDYHRGPAGQPQDYQPGPPGPPMDYHPGPPGPQHRPPGPPQDYNHRPPGSPQNYPGAPEYHENYPGPPGHHENYPGPPGAFQQEGLLGAEPTDKKAKKGKSHKENKKNKDKPQKKKKNEEKQKENNNEEKSNMNKDEKKSNRRYRRHEPPNMQPPIQPDRQDQPMMGVRPHGPQDNMAYVPDFRRSRQDQHSRHFHDRHSNMPPGRKGLPLHRHHGAINALMAGQRRSELPPMFHRHRQLPRMDMDALMGALGEDRLRDISNKRTSRWTEGEEEDQWLTKDTRIDQDGGRHRTMELEMPEYDEPEMIPDYAGCRTSRKEWGVDFEESR